MKHLAVLCVLFVAAGACRAADDNEPGIASDVPVRLTADDGGDLDGVTFDDARRLLRRSTVDEPLHLGPLPPGAPDGGVAPARVVVDPARQILSFEFESAEVLHLVEARWFAERPTDPQVIALQDPVADIEATGVPIPALAALDGETMLVTSTDDGLVPLGSLVGGFDIRDRLDRFGIPTLELAAGQVGIVGRPAGAAALAEIGPDGDLSAVAIPLDPSTREISVPVEVTTPETFPDWITLDSPWMLQSSGSTTTLEGRATIDFGDGDPTPVAVVASLVAAGNGSGESLLFQARTGSIDDVLGHDFLDLDSIELEIRLDDDSMRGSIEGHVVIGPVDTSVEVELNSANGLLTGSAVLRAKGPVESGELFDAMDVDLTRVPAPFSVMPMAEVAVQASRTITDNGLIGNSTAVTATVEVEVPAGTVGAGLLVRFIPRTGVDSVLAAVMFPALRSTDLFENAAPVDLPVQAIAAASVDISERLQSLDPVTRSFFEPALCSSGPCYDLVLDKGVQWVGEVIAFQPAEIGFAAPG